MEGRSRVWDFDALVARMYRAGLPKALTGENLVSVCFCTFMFSVCCHAMVCLKNLQVMVMCVCCLYFMEDLNLNRAARHFLDRVMWHQVLYGVLGFRDAWQPGRIGVQRNSLQERPT